MELPDQKIAPFPGEGPVIDAVAVQKGGVEPVTHLLRLVDPQRNVIEKTIEGGVVLVVVSADHGVDPAAGGDVPGQFLVGARVDDGLAFVIDEQRSAIRVARLLSPGNYGDTSEFSQFHE